MNSLKYYLTRSHNEDTLESFNKFISALNTIQGLGIQREDTERVVIFYEKVPHRATLEFITPAGKEMGEEFDYSQPILTLSCDQVDNLTVNLIKPVSKDLGYRIFNPNLGCYLPDDPNLFDTTTAVLDEKISTAFKTKGYKPLFYFVNTIVFFAQAKDKSIHLINSYLLDYFLKFGIEEEETPEFSYQVSPNLSQFIPMYNKGLVPIAFYDYYQKSTKIINYSGFNIYNVKRKIFVKPYIFELNDKNQAFYSIDSEGSSLLYADKIRKGETLDATIKRILKKELKIADDYIGARVNRDIEFDRDKEDRLVPRLLVSIFVDKIKDRSSIRERSKRGWRSLNDNPA